MMTKKQNLEVKSLTDEVIEGSFWGGFSNFLNRIGAFIQKAKNDVEYQPSPEEIDAEADEPEEKEDEPEEKEEKEPKEEPKDNQKQKDWKAAGNSDKSDKKKDDKKEKPVKEQFFDSSASTV